jgi:hypothetical protein
VNANDGLADAGYAFLSLQSFRIEASLVQKLEPVQQIAHNARHVLHIVAHVGQRVLQRTLVFRVLVAPAPSLEDTLYPSCKRKRISENEAPTLPDNPTAAMMIMPTTNRRQPITVYAFTEAAAGGQKPWKRIQYS